MKKSSSRRFMLALTLMMALFIISTVSGFSAIAAPAAGDMWPDGKGTKSDPYIITTAEQLNAIRDDLAAHYMLGNDIDLTAFLSADKAGWQPIGSNTPYGRFTGNLDGDGYKITGLWVNRRSDKSVGLFGYANGSTIKNLGVELAVAGVKGREDTGGLIGRLENGKIENCYVNGSVSGGYNTGGLAGISSSIENCHAIGSVNGGDYTGGLVGTAGSIKSCYTAGDVSGGKWTGGLVGLGGSIENCYATGNINGNDFTGGLVGVQLGSGLITNSYATGNVNGGDYTGGLLGCQYSSVGKNSAINCYATGNVNGGSNTGGLIGWQQRSNNSDNIINNCYVLGDVSGGANTGAVVGQQSKQNAPQNLRVDGYTEPKDNGENIIENCYRYEAVSVNGKMISAKGANSAPSKIHGGVKTAIELTTQDTYERNGWKFGASGPWYWDDGLYPKLNLGEEKNPFGFSFTITYHLNNGMQQDGAPQRYILGQVLILPTPISVKGDQDFAGWYDNAAFTGNAIRTITASDTGDKELWAKWEGTAPDYPLIARPTAATVLVNGKNVAFDAYNISGNNYFKLRDLAFVLSGTEKKFEVGWDAANNAISLSSGQPYSAVGGEMQGKGAGEKTPIPTRSKIYLDGTEVQFTAYTIEGNNYFKLRDIGQTFDFGVGWDGTTNTITIDTSTGYGE